MQAEQGFPQPLLGTGLAQLGALAQLDHHAPHIALAKAEPAQPGETLVCTSIERGCCGWP